MDKAINVFAPSIPMRWDEDDLIKKPKIDIRPAKQYGIIRVVLNEDEKQAAAALPVQETVKLIRQRMRNAKAEDFVLAVGDPVWIAAASSYQLFKFGKVKMLRWDRLNQRYDVMEFES